MPLYLHNVNFKSILLFFLGIFFCLYFILFIDLQLNQKY